MGGHVSFGRPARTPLPSGERLIVEEHAIAELLAEAGHADATSLAPVMVELGSGEDPVGTAPSPPLSSLLMGKSSPHARRRSGLKMVIVLSCAAGAAMGVGTVIAVSPDFRESARLTVNAFVGSLTAGSGPLPPVAAEASRDAAGGSSTVDSFEATGGSRLGPRTESPAATAVDSRVSAGSGNSEYVRSSDAAIKADNAEHARNSANPARSPADGPSPPARGG